MRPVIPIKLKHGTSSVNYEVLVDSGADLCILDSGMKKLLGLDITGGKPYNVGGIAGQSAKYYVHTVEMEIGGWPYKIEAGFLPNVSGFNYGVVGQKGFFDIFTVKFDLSKGEVKLKEIRE